MDDDQKGEHIPPVGPHLKAAVEQAEKQGAAAMEAASTGNGTIPEVIWVVPPSRPKRQAVPPNPNLASEFLWRLEEWITDFEKDLDQEHEVGVRLVSFGQTVTFHLENIRTWDPSLISFAGFTESGDPVELVQHVSQISILLMKVRRKTPEEPKRSIGFTAVWPEQTDR